MMKYERLTERKNNSTGIYVTNWKGEKVWGDAYDLAEEHLCSIDDVFDRLAELEDKIENGTLIELPCKDLGAFPEGVVVLTREEYELFSSIKKGFPNDTSWLAEKYSEIGQTARIRTAEKYHAEIEKAIESVPNATKEFVEAWKAKNDEIAKEITEGSNG